MWLVKYYEPFGQIVGINLKVKVTFFIQLVFVVFCWDVNCFVVFAK